MKTRLKLMLTAATFGLAFGAGTAHAQGGPPGGQTPTPQPPPTAGLSAENGAVRNGGDSYEREMNRARDEAIAKERGSKDAAKGAHGVPAKPEDVVVGAEVRDSKGVVIGTVDSVSMSAAVIASAGGKVEVPLEAFGKNSKGLLFGMTKAEFDAAVASANKPAGG